MVFDSINNGFSYFINNINLNELVLPLLIYTLVMVVYALFI